MNTTPESLSTTGITVWTCSNCGTIVGGNASHTCNVRTGINIPSFPLRETCAFAQHDYAQFNEDLDRSRIFCRKCGTVRDINAL